MKVYFSAAELQADLTLRGKTIGFVPTMGALHSGHISLIQRAKKENDVVVCSVFVNPTQFNNKKDLERYPRTLEHDTKMLESAECDILFTPSVTEIYPAEDERVYDFGELDKVMEGEFRPGHFNGVAMVVRRLFEIVKPTRAYFGEKDFQQLAIVRKLNSILNLGVEIVGCPIIREPDGLAMSSRNVLLDQNYRQSATRISQTLFKAKTLISKMSAQKLEEWVLEEIKKDSRLEPEYFKIVNAETLLPVKDWAEAKSIVGCIAVMAGTTRLIDNVVLIP
jgi:pantoate--beta-alanine ligase